MSTPWYEKAYRRNVVDMHITDCDERFLSQFDADNYVKLLLQSQVQSAVLYAHSHVGLCYYPTRIGRMHPGLRGQDIFAQVVERCHRNGIAVVAYYSLIHDCWAYDNYPDWRIIRADGEEAAAEGRYGVCCPNSPYRDYMVKMVRELCGRYEFEGIRFDMTFWPQVCYCRHCGSRYADEVGGEIPRTVNWEDSLWTGFQRKREEWLTDFAALATSTARSVRPELSIEHQSSTFNQSWILGVTEQLASQTTFLQGDFYGDALQGSFVRKLLSSLSPNQPYGFETSITTGLNNHTALKSKELLKAKAYAAVADNGAFIFIDAIDPVGTLNPKVYERMGEIFEEVKAYDLFRGGKRCQDVAIYWSTESKCDFADNGKPITEVDRGALPHLDAALGATHSLMTHHIPFGVITKKGLASLAQHQVLVLPNVLMMDEEEVAAIRAWVADGGALYASKYSSLVTKAGERQVDFLLADVFGVSYRGKTKEGFTYIAPGEGREDLFGDYSAKYPAGFAGTQFIVEAGPGAKVLGTTTLPYTDTADPHRFAAIHSNPPGDPSGNPAIVMNRYGKGGAIYAAAEVEASDTLQHLFVGLIRLLSGRFSFQANAPGVVEVTLFHQKDRKRFLINLINFQKDLPNIPVDDIEVRVRLDGRRPRRVLLLPREREIEYAVQEEYAVFTVPRLHTFHMLALDYQ